MFLLVWILVLKRKDWDIRPAGSGIYEKGTFTGRDFIPGSYPSLCFIPPSLRSPATLVLHECVTCLGKRDQLAPAPKKDYQKNITIVQPWCSPESSSHLVKATWGFSCVFAPIVLILVSLCLLLFRDPLFHADVIWQLWSTKREERWLVATASYLNFELLSPRIAFFECFVFSGRMHSIKL